MNASDWQIFLICFSFPFLVAVFVQFIFLPYIAPAWNAGHGLLVGLDSVNYHQMAVELAQKIHQQGWSAWTLHTEDSAHFGLMNITAAIYALTIPQQAVVRLGGKAHVWTIDAKNLAHLTPVELGELVDRFAQPNAVVLGDAVLDVEHVGDGSLTRLVAAE